MGANVSSSMANEDEGPRLEDLPENCVALVLSFLDPPDVCRFARLNRTFRAASFADCVWDPKLPENYRFLMETLGLGDETKTTKKKKLGKREIFAELCRRNYFHGATKEIWLDKRTSDIFLSISWKGMRITGIDDRRYWNFISTEESRFRSVAYLQQTWWFEVGGEIEFEFPTGNYSVLMRLHLGRPARRLGRRVCQHEHVHGWDVRPVKFQLSTSDGQRDVSHCCLGSPGAWVDYRVGSFAARNPGSPMKIKFLVTQIDCTHTKGGVCVDSVLIRPRGREKEATLLPEPCRRSNFR